MRCKIIFGIIAVFLVINVLAWLAPKPAHAQVVPTTPPSTDTSTTSPPTTSPPPVSGVTPTDNSTNPDEQGSDSTGFDSGVDGLMQGPNLQGNNKCTLNECFPTSSWSLHYSCSWSNVTCKVENLLASWTSSLRNIGVSLMGKLFSANLYFRLGDVFGGSAKFQSIEGTVINALGRNIALGFAAGIIIFLGLGSIIYRLTRDVEISRAFTSLVWMVGGLVLLVFFLSSYTTFLGHDQEIRNAPVLTALAAIGKGEAQNPPPDTLLQSQGANPVVAPTFNGDPSKQEVRRIMQRWTEVLIHKPTMLEQFGSMQAAQRYGLAWLESRTLPQLTPQQKQSLIDSYTHGKLDQGSVDMEKQLQARRAAIKKEIQKDPQAWSWFQGHHSFERLMISAFTFLVVAGICLFLTLGLIAVIILDVGFTFFFMLAPLFLVAGIHPDRGRQIAFRWASVTAILYFAHAILQIVIITVVFVSTAILGSTASSSGSWLLVMVFMLVLMACPIVFWGVIRYILTGQRPGAARGVRGFLGGIAGGAVSVAGTGAELGWRGLRGGAGLIGQGLKGAGQTGRWATYDRFHQEGQGPSSRPAGFRPNASPGSGWGGGLSHVPIDYEPGPRAIARKPSAGRVLDARSRTKELPRGPKAIGSGSNGTNGNGKGRIGPTGPFHTPID